MTNLTIAGVHLQIDMEEHILQIVIIFFTFSCTSQEIVILQFIFKRKKCNFFTIFKKKGEVGNIAFT